MAHQRRLGLGRGLATLLESRRTSRHSNTQWPRPSNIGMFDLNWGKVFNPKNGGMHRKLHAQRLCLENVSRLQKNYWLDYLFKAAGTNSYYKLEKYIFSRHLSPMEFAQRRSKLIKTYAMGATPNERTLRRIDERIPGSRYIFHHPLWTALSPCYPWTLEMAWEAMSRLQPPIPHSLFREHGDSQPISFVRIQTRDISLPKIAAEASILDRIALRLCLLREQQVIGDQSQCLLHQLALSDELRASHSEDLILKKHFTLLMNAIYMEIYEIEYDAEILELNADALLASAKRALASAYWPTPAPGEQYESRSLRR